MPMVGHQAVRENSDGHARMRLPEHSLERIEITTLFKDLTACNGAVQDVVDDPARGSSQWSSHYC